MSDPWHINTGRSPRNQDAEVEVIWANQQPARRTFLVKQLDWRLRDWDFDVWKYRRVK